MKNEKQAEPTAPKKLHKPVRAESDLAREQLVTYAGENADFQLR